MLGTSLEIRSECVQRRACPDQAECAKDKQQVCKNRDAVHNKQSVCSISNMLLQNVECFQVMAVYRMSGARVQDNQSMQATRTVCAQNRYRLYRRSRVCTQRAALVCRTKNVH